MGPSVRRGCIGCGDAPSSSVPPSPLPCPSLSSAPSWPPALPTIGDIQAGCPALPMSGRCSFWGMWGAQGYRPPGGTACRWGMRAEFAVRPPCGVPHLASSPASCIFLLHPLTHIPWPAVHMSLGRCLSFGVVVALPSPAVQPPRALVSPSTARKDERMHQQAQSWCAPGLSGTHGECLHAVAPHRILTTALTSIWQVGKPRHTVEAACARVLSHNCGLPPLFCGFLEERKWGLLLQ